MSTPPDRHQELSPTLELSEYTNPKNGSYGFWLYDTTRGMNLAMRAKTSTDALVQAIHYYQRRVLQVELDLRNINEQVDKFVSNVRPMEDKQ